MDDKKLGNDKSLERGKIRSVRVGCLELNRNLSEGVIGGKHQTPSSKHRSTSTFRIQEHSRHPLQMAETFQILQEIIILRKNGRCHVSLELKVCDLEAKILHKGSRHEVLCLASTNDRKSSTPNQSLPNVRKQPFDLQT